jgi:RHS repeat-associated protein
MVIMPHFNFQGAQFSDGLDLVLLGARHYRPALARFISPDRYLALNQEKIVGIAAAANLYLYALGNPANFTDPTGQIVFLVVLLIAAVVGAVLGAIGAAVNGAKTWDEWLLWIVGGAIGGVLTAATGGLLGYIFGGAAAVVTGSIIATVIWGVGSLIGTALTPLLDDSNSSVAWFFSFLLKWIQSPITTTIGLIAALVVAIGGGHVDLRRGMLFIEVGAGGGALTLGAVAWTQSGRFDAMGHVSDDLARHESFHSRTVAAIGELGFYFTYVTFGAIWGVAQGGSWNDLNAMGCGNPFEKTAHTFTGDPAVAVSASSC